MRKLFLILLSLLLGVASTVAIAWRSAWTQLQLGTSSPDGTPAPRFVGPIPAGSKGVGLTNGTVLVERGTAPGTELWVIVLYKSADLPDTFKSRGDLHIPSWVRRLAFPWEFNAQWQGDDIQSRTIIARGWPYVTLWSGSRLKSKSETIDNGAFYLEGWLRKYGPRGPLVVYPSAAAFDVPFPFRPVWAPFLISSTLLAAPFHLLFMGPGALRRWARRRRHCCERCGYDRRGLSPAVACPECGLTPQRAS